VKSYTCELISKY